MNCFVVPAVTVAEAGEIVTTSGEVEAVNVTGREFEKKELGFARSRLCFPAVFMVPETVCWAGEMYVG